MLFQRLVKSAAMLIFAGCAAVTVFAQGGSFDVKSETKAVQKLVGDGNFAEAFTKAKKALETLPENAHDKEVADLWNYLVISLENNNRIAEYDENFAFATKKFKNNLNFLCTLSPEDSWGYMIDGKFRRGNNRGNGGRYVSCEYRDRVEILRLLVAAVPAAEKAEDALAVKFYLRLANFLIQDASSSMTSWKLQALTDLTKLPDYDEHPVRSSSRPPVNPDGSPVLYAKPADFSSAGSDGERIRWAWEAAMARGSKEAKIAFATFLAKQFDFSQVDYGLREEYFQSDTYRDYLYGLKDNETVAQLSDGTRKITLPEEYNYFRLFSEAEDWRSLMSLYLARYQYEKAAYYADKAKDAEMKAMIEGNVGFADYIQVTAFGKKPVLTYHYRNSKEVVASVHKVNSAEAVRVMLDNLSKPDSGSSGNFTDVYQLYLHDWDGQLAKNNKWKVAIEDKVTEFKVALKPKAHHWETDQEIELPLTEPGAYLVNLAPENAVDGSFTEILVWITPQILTANSLPDKTIFTVNDSSTGMPLAKRTLKYYNFVTRYANTPQERTQFGGRTKVTVTEKEFVTDANGVADAGKLSSSNRTLILLESEDKLAVIPSAYFYNNRAGSMRDNQKVFIIPDRPAYRPGDTVKFAVYSRTPSYKEPFKETHLLPNPVKVIVTDARGSKVCEEKLTVDAETNSTKGEFTLPEDITLGNVNLHLEGQPGSIGIAVEEYKKPEYLLSVKMPEMQVKSGGMFEAEIEAKYYFGAPMSGAKIKYKVYREQTNRVYPFYGRFDWLFGAGYWICSTGMRDRCLPEAGFGRDLVVSDEGDADENGRLTVPIDTADALRRFGEHDYRYSIEAEVTDETNRVVKGSGSIITASQPFYVEMSAKCGFGHTGKPVTIVTKAVTPDGKPVQGRGKLKIYGKALNAQGVPERVGEPLKTVDVVAGDENGISFVMDRPGVYEIVTEITSQPKIDPKKAAVPKPETCTGTYPLVISGFEKSGNLFSELPVEITSDKSEYLPGDEAEILVNTKKPGYSLYFFARSERVSNWEFVRAEGSSTVFKMKIDTDDRPNTYVSVLAVGNGEILRLSKMLAVPPVTKMLNVAIEGPKTNVKPGADVPVTVRVTDSSGKPVSGAMTMTVYDKSLDAVASSRIPEINSFFWNWKRYQSENYSSNLDKSTRCMVFRQSQWQLCMNTYLQYYFPLERDRDTLFQQSVGMVRRERVKTRSASNGVMMKSMAADADMAMEESMPMAGMGGFGGAALMMDEAAPAPAAARMTFAAKEMASDDMAEAEEDMSASAEKNDDFVRSNFLDSAFWSAMVKLDADGRASFTIPAPDNLTTWRIRAWSLAPDASVGTADAEFTVSKDLIARLELPRFMVNGDKVSAVANIHNYTGREINAQVALKTDNSNVAVAVPSVSVKIAPNSHTACPFELTSKAVGETTFTLTVKAGDETDALELKMPVLVKGIDKQVNGFARLDKDIHGAVIPLKVPAQRKPETTFLTVNAAPGAAKAMVELLPYLAADGTPNVFGVVNRFVPATATAYALSKMGIDFKKLNLKPTNRDKLYAEYMDRYCWNNEPVPSFEAAQFAKVNADSLKMILGMVNSDGGWGWFSGYREVSWPDTTAYVVNALMDVQEFGDGSVKSAISGGVKWLENEAAERVAKLKDHPDWGVSNTDALVARVLTRAGKPNKELLNFLYDQRVDHLAPYGLAMLALALPEKSDERAMVVRNLTQFLKVDDENQTAYLNIPASFCWFWYGEENETNAAYLDLLLADNPADKVAPKLANYLVTNIRNSPWRNSTRAIGAVVRSLARCIVATAESKPDMTVRVMLDGKEVKSWRITSDNVWDGEFVFSAGPEIMTTGDHELKLSMDGTGVLYVNTRLNYFTMEDVIEPAGLEMKIKRNYYRLTPSTEDYLAAGVSGSVQQLKRDKYKRTLLKDGDFLRAGELVEVELISTAKNDYDYVCFADSMPAGFEFVEPVSGYSWQWGAPIYREYRERGAKFYLRSMARGDTNVFYQIRAQLNGRFTSLPAIGSGLYAPELKCNSTLFTFEIR